MIRITPKQTCLILGLVGVVCAIVGIYVARVGREPPVPLEFVRYNAACNAFLEFGGTPDVLQRTADEAAEVLNSLRKEYQNETPKMSPDVQSIPLFQIAAKYFGERDYGKSLDAFTEGVRVLGEEHDRHVIVASYLAGLSSRADWLEKQLESKWSKTSDLLKRFVRMNVHWARKDYAQVEALGKLQETRTQTSTQPSGTQQASQWVVFLRAKSLKQMGRENEAYEIIWSGAFLLRMRSMVPYYRWLSLHVYTMASVLAEETGHPDDALKLATVLRGYPWLHRDASWAEDKKRLYEMIERLTPNNGTTVPASTPHE